MYMYVSWPRHNFLPRAPLDYDYILSSPLSPYLSVPDCVCTGLRTTFSPPPYLLICLCQTVSVLDYDYILSSPLSPYLSVPDCVCTGLPTTFSPPPYLLICLCQTVSVLEEKVQQLQQEAESQRARHSRDTARLRRRADEERKTASKMQEATVSSPDGFSLFLSPPLSPSLPLSLPLFLSYSFSLPCYMYILCYFLHNILAQVAGLKTEWHEEMKRMKQTHQKEIGTIRDKVCKSLSATKEKQ